eukprot:7301632-Prymnesium_polylepis.1
MTSPSPCDPQLLEDPVLTADGQTYERSAIARWLETHGTSPLSGEPLENKVRARAERQPAAACKRGAARRGHMRRSSHGAVTWGDRMGRSHGRPRAQPRRRRHCPPGARVQHPRPQP